MALVFDVMARRVGKIHSNIYFEKEVEFLNPKDVDVYLREKLSGTLGDHKVEVWRDDTFKNEYSAEEWLHHRMSVKNWNESPEEN